MKQPPKRMVDQLVQAHARSIHSKADGAPYQAQVRLQNTFNRKLETLRTQYPYIDTTSREFWDRLETESEKWWKKRAFRGTGTDW